MHSSIEINSKDGIGEESKQAFHEYEQNQKERNIKMHKIIIAFISLINIILFLFVILYKYQISKLRTSSIATQNELTRVKNETEKTFKKTIHNILNINAFYNSDSIFFSMVLKSMNDIDVLKEFLIQKENVHFAMLYQSFDGDLKDRIIEFCDNYENLLILIQTRQDARFGGYINVKDVTFNKAEIESDVRIIDNDAFLFSLDKKQKYQVKNGNNAFFILKDGIFKFGEEDLVIGNDYLIGKNSYSRFPKDYMGEDKTSSGINPLIDGEDEMFEISEIEIYTIFVY